MDKTYRVKTKYHTHDSEDRLVMQKHFKTLCTWRRLLVIQQANGLSDLFITQIDGTLSEASVGYTAWIEDHNLGSSNLLPTSGDVYRNGKLYARISYNGRVWALDGTTPHPDSAQKTEKKLPSVPELSKEFIRGEKFGIHFAGKHEIQDDAHMNLWNEAWALAKQVDFDEKLVDKFWQDKQSDKGIGQRLDDLRYVDQRDTIAKILAKYAENMVDPNEGADIAVCEKVADEVLKALKAGDQGGRRR